MPATRDLRKAHVTSQHGELVVVFSWVNGEQAMVLLPAHRPGAPRYIVCDSTAWRYDDPAYLARQCVVACDVLGIEPSRPNWVRVAGIIHDGLPDLVKMPSNPPAEFHRGSFGEMTLRADSHLIRDRLLRIEPLSISAAAQIRPE
jgi:hypothetical protein